MSRLLEILDEYEAANSRASLGQRPDPTSLLETASKDAGLSVREILAGLNESETQSLHEGQITQSELTAFARARADRKLRESGRVPPGYTSVTCCAGCGDVPIWPGVPEHIEGCPWCFNRAQGLPVPEIPRDGGVETV